MRTLYRLFSKGIFDIDTLPMKGKRKPNGHQEKRGKQQYQRSIHDRPDNYPDFNSEFGHLEGDTIVGIHHKSAVITLVERLSKVIITIKPNGRKALDIETALNQWFSRFPKNFFKSITFVEKNFLTGKPLVTNTILIYILRTLEHLLNAH